MIFRTSTAIWPDVFAEGADRPTISLVPANGSDEVRLFLTPISAEYLIFLIQTGWPASTILQLWVERLNGVPNVAPADGPRCDPAADAAASGG